MRSIWFVFGVVALLSELPSLTHAETWTVSGVLRQSAIAEINDSGHIDVHTTDNDAIEFTLEHVGADSATFNGEFGQFELRLIKRELDALYYRQSFTGGIIIWAYFPNSRTVTYAKIRSVPVTGDPSSYLMITKGLRLAGSTASQYGKRRGRSAVAHVAA